LVSNLDIPQPMATVEGGSHARLNSPSPRPSPRGRGLKAYEAKVLETEARLLRKLAKKQGFTLVPDTAQ